MDFSELSADQNLLERINPVFNTAKMTLFQLAITGDQNAIAISDKLGLTMEKTNDTNSQEELHHNVIILETRFRTMGALAEQSGFPTEVDLPCGYTPRAIEFARKGIRFVGLDLPAAIDEAKPAIMSLIDEDKHHLVRFEGVDATNYESLKKVFDEIPGEVCITTEGLLMYFTDSESGQLCENIRRILQEHGGCWITADPETAIQFVLTVRAFYGEKFMDILMKDKKKAEKRSDVDVSDHTLVVNPRDAEGSIRKAMGFLALHGLKAERMIVGEYTPELQSLKMVTPEQAETIKQAMKQFAYWKITPIAGKKLDTTATKAESFDMKAEMSDETLLLQLFGRLDTLTAPGLLAFYEKTAEDNKVSGVIVDCNNLDYISSAGLRVLLIMQKQCGKGVTVKNINETVKEILEQTGFDSILNVENPQNEV